MLLVFRVTLIFLLVAVLAGGIAMLANQLGRKIGRRKMTVFGMRPRHTSIFITTLTGSLIAVSTLALAMVFSQDVRDMVAGSQARVEKLQQRETQLLQRVRELAEDVRRGTIVWNYDERIALNTIPAGASERAVSNILNDLLSVANFVSIGKNNKIAFRQNESLFDTDTVLLEYSSDDLRHWIEEYAGLEKPVGLWVVVTENCLFGDSIPVKVQSFEVDLIYPEGETVFSRELAPAEAFLDWHIFLEDLKAAALRKGMIEMNNSLGGEITQDTLLEISRTFTENDGKIRVRAVANRDLYQSSNLDVSIEVEPVVQ